jgi:P-type conjugative transfer protein TrbJ
MTLPLVLGVVTSCVPRSAAQLTVFDPANFQQNLLSATRALEQITNQVRVLQNQVLMIARMDQSLVRLGATMSPDLQKTLGDIQALLRAGDGIVLSLAATQSGFDQLFPKQAAALTHDGVLRNAKARWDEEYAAFQRAALPRCRGCAGSRAGRQRAHGPQRQAGARAARAARRAIPRRDDEASAGPRRGG